MILPAKFNGLAVVAVNEFPPKGALPTGHTNVTFFWHGVDRGTFGFNSQGKDAAGKNHPRGPVSFTIEGGAKMPGGVFIEDEKNAHIHLVIVSERNFNRMYAFAKGQAEITATKNNQTYVFLSNNCADFVYKVFAQTDLTTAQKDIYSYLQDKGEPVAEYAAMSQGYYRQIESVHDTRHGAPTR